MLGRRFNAWRMLCRYWLFGSLFGRCFATESVLVYLGGYLAAVVAWSSLTDALSPSLPDTRLSSLGGYFATTALSIL
jgi:hypothetical protein